MSAYRAGIVGAGGVAGLGLLGLHDEADIGRKKFTASHAGGYAATEGVELVAVADVDAEKLATFGEAWEIPEAHRYEDTGAMLDAEALDVVSVCTPSLYHHDPVLAAAEADATQAVLCEKPIAASVAEADAMVDACAANGVELVVNHTFRFTEKLARVRDLVVEEGLIGDVHAASAGFRMELMRNATHVFDTLGWLLDADPVSVSGHLTGENEAAEALAADRRVDDVGGGGFAVYDDGTFATVDCTVPREASSMRFELIGDAGKLYLNNDDGEWRYWGLEDGAHVERELPGVDGPWTWEEDYERGFPNAVGHVVDLLEGRTTNRSPGGAATTALEAIVALFVSGYTGSRIGLPLEAPLRDVTITSW